MSYVNMILLESGLKEKEHYHLERLATCAECSNQSSKCPKCGCPLKALISGGKDNCGLNKWVQ